MLMIPLLGRVLCFLLKQEASRRYLTNDETEIKVDTHPTERKAPGRMVAVLTVILSVCERIE